MKRKIIVVSLATIVISAAFLIFKNDSITGELGGVNRANSIEPVAQNDSKLHGFPLVSSTKSNVDLNLVSEFKLMQQEIAILKSDLKALHMEMSNAKLAKLAPSNTQAKAYENLSTEEIRKQESERQNKETEAIELGFKQQTKDQTWADKVTGQIQQALSNAQVAPDNIVSIDCRVTMCRVEVINDGQEGKAFEMFSTNVSTEFPNIRADQSEMTDGNIITVMYLSKDDFVSPGNGS